MSRLPLDRRLWRAPLFAGDLNEGGHPADPPELFQDRLIDMDAAALASSGNRRTGSSGVPSAKAQGAEAA